MTKIVDNNEAEIEAEIRRELAALTDDQLQVDEEDEFDNDDSSGFDAEFNNISQGDEALPASLQQYLDTVHSRLEGLVYEVQECDEVLELSTLDDQYLFAKKIKETLGDEYAEFDEVKDKVLSEINAEEQNESKLDENDKVVEKSMAVDVIKPDLPDDIQALEQAARQQLKELEEKQALKVEQRKNMYEELRLQEEERRRHEQEERSRILKQFDEQKQIATQEHKVQQVNLEKEMQLQQMQTLLDLQLEYQAELKGIEEEKKREQNMLKELKMEEARNTERRLHSAAVQIQKVYRGYRVYKNYKDILAARMRQRFREREEELDRIERVEKKQQEMLEKNRKKEEERKQQELEEKKQREVEEKKLLEERKQKEMEEKVREQEEKKQKEELERKRLEEERNQEEEERRKAKELEEQRKKEEKERERKEREKRELEEKKRKEEEERRRLEALEEQKRREEEERRKDREKKELEEMKKRKEEETRQKEAEARRHQEEQQSIEKAKREQEALETETRQKEEEKRLQQVKEDEKKRLEEEQLRLQEKKREETSRKQECMPHSGETLGLSAELEKHRLQWLANHTPWREHTSEYRSHPIAKVKAPSRRPYSASKGLLSLTDQQLLSSSPAGTTLNKVVQVFVQHAGPYNMQSLRCCLHLKSLTLRDCGIMAVEGLEDCQDLIELNIQNNEVEFVNCGELRQLQRVNLSHNQLKSLQGLEGCVGLRVLDVSNNRITRMGNLASFPKLQILTVDNNQLISIKGLSSLPHLRQLSCTNNHIPLVQELDKCHLLQVVHLQANNLQQPPRLTSNMLLRVLCLDDNSISSLEPLANAWLPLLQVLSISQNSISCIEVLSGLPLLSKLNISYNLITDLDGIIPGLAKSSELHTLIVEGNPVSEEPQFREAIITALPFLSVLDQESLQPEINHADVPSFVEMCKKQLKTQDDMMERHQTQIRNCCQEEQLEARLELESKHFEECNRLAVQHLREHESFSAQQKNPRPEEKSSGSEQKGVSLKLDRGLAATKIQALWRGWSIRHRIEVQMRRWLAAVAIQAAWRGYRVRARRPKSRPVSRARKALSDVREHAAATAIQACYRGYRVRWRLEQALLSAHDADMDMDDEDFNYDEEVDLTAFDFDDVSLESGWTPTDMPQLPSRGPVLPSKLAVRGEQATPSKNFRPRQAWRSADSPISVRAAGRDKPAGMTLPIENMEQDIQSVTSGTQSHLTHRAEEMSNEWGLKNVSTAELMWKRANKMKYNPARKRKMLDPSKRLALFKKLDEINKLKEVRPPPKRQPPKRIEYFAAREAGILPSGSATPTSERETKAEMTYSWVYNQGVILQEQELNQSPRASKPPPRPLLRPPPVHSPVSLPHMDPVSLSGRSVPLVSNPSLVEEHVTRRTPPARPSSLSDEVRFPPVKTHSVPNLTARSDASTSSQRSPEKSNSAGARITKGTRKQR